MGGQARQGQQQSRGKASFQGGLLYKRGRGSTHKGLWEKGCVPRTIWERQVVLRR